MLAFPFFGLGMEDGHVPSFWLLLDFRCCPRWLYDSFESKILSPVGVPVRTGVSLQQMVLFVRYMLRGCFYTYIYVYVYSSFFCCFFGGVSKSPAGWGPCRGPRVLETPCTALFLKRAVRMGLQKTKPSSTWDAVFSVWGSYSRNEKLQGFQKPVSRS